MIFVTGDTHNQQNFAKLLDFAKAHPLLNKDDYVIIVGDFGAVYDKDNLEKDLKPYSDLPFSVLFVDGNHENFDLLNAYPIEMWKGGKVHRIKPDIIHLMRGQVFEIEGKTFFTFGGATSKDKAKRLSNDLGWWEQECPTYEEYDEGVANLKRYNYKVDYVITHTCGVRTLMYPSFKQNYTIAEYYFENKLFLNFEDMIDFKHWYFGHYHFDQDINDKMTILYRNIILIE